MREFRKSGSVGAPGGKPPGATRPLLLQRGPGTGLASGTPPDVPMEIGTSRGVAAEQTPAARRPVRVWRGCPGGLWGQMP